MRNGADGAGAKDEMTKAQMTKEIQRPKMTKRPLTLNPFPEERELFVTVLNNLECVSCDGR